MAGFFHWDVRTHLDSERYRGLAFVQYQPEPVLRFTTTAAASTTHLERGKAFWLSKGELHHRDFAAPAAHPSWKRLASRLDLADNMQLLLDVLYVERRSPGELVGSTRLLLRPRLGGPYEPHARWIREHPRYRERLLRAALKLAYSRSPISGWARSVLEGISRAI